MKRGYFLFIIVCMLIMLFPFAGLLASPSQEISETGTEVALPKLKDDDGSINVSYLSDMGDYFSDNFAFRQQLVHANAWLYGNIFQTSATDQVVLGTDGWMYYTGTLNDYSSSGLMTERALNNAVHNIGLIQDYVEGKGSKFVFTIAPNKNSLYDSNMPYFYREGIEDNNYDRLLPKLTEAGINYVNLFDVFNSRDEVLYFKEDSHWRNKGAALAFENIMDSLGLEHCSYEDVPYELTEEHLGDLKEMIYPLDESLEANEIYQKDWLYSYVGEVSSNMDNWIMTESDVNDSTLLMYRDSFGEALLPFFADEFGTAYFSRLVPYNLNDITTYSPDYVVVERVERRISSFAEAAAVMDMPQVDVSDMDTETVLSLTLDKGISELSETGEHGSISIEVNGDYYMIGGIVDASFMDDDDSIYLEFEQSDGSSIVYDTFWISQETENGISDTGYSVYMLKNAIPADLTGIKVLKKN